MCQTELFYYALQETDYRCKVTMPTAEFLRICKVLRAIGEEIRITIDGKVTFSSSGDLGEGNNAVAVCLISVYPSPLDKMVIVSQTKL